MQTVVLTIHLILALLMIGIVLLQRSEAGGGLMSSGGGAMTGRAAATAMTKLTWVLAAGFICTSITLTILAARDAGSTSVVEQFGGTAPAPAAPELPLGSDLLPPAPVDAPLAPPRADTTAPADGAAPADGTPAPATSTPAPAGN